MKILLLKRIKSFVDVLSIIVVNLISIYAIFEIIEKVPTNSSLLTGFTLLFLYLNFVNIQVRVAKERKKSLFKKNS